MYRQILKDVSSCIKNMIFKGTALDPSTFEKTCEGRALEVAKAVLPSHSPPGHAEGCFAGAKGAGVKKVDSLKASVWGDGCFFV